MWKNPRKRKLESHPIGEKPMNSAAIPGSFLLEEQKWILQSKNKDDTGYKDASMRVNREKLYLFTKQ